MKKLMQPFKVGEDVGLFLVNFERTCEKLSFAPETWPQRLLTLLPCEAAEVVARLSAGDADDYDKVKSSLLKRYRLSAEAFRQRFRNASKKSSEGYSEFAYGLKTNLIEWLKSEEVYESRDKVVECVCLEQFFRSIPQSVKLWVQDRVGVDSVERAAELAEEYATRRKLSGEESEPGRSDQRKTFRQGNGSRENGPEKPEAGQKVPEKSAEHSNGDEARKSPTGQFEARKPFLCYNCQEPGHTAARCKKPRVVFSYVNGSDGDLKLLRPYLHELQRLLKAYSKPTSSGQRLYHRPFEVSLAPEGLLRMEPSATFFRVSTLRKRVPKQVPTCSGLTPTCRRLPKTCLNASVTSTGRVCVCVWVRALRKGRTKRAKTMSAGHDDARPSLLPSPWIGHVPTRFTDKAGRLPRFQMESEDEERISRILRMQRQHREQLLHEMSPAASFQAACAGDNNNGGGAVASVAQGAPANRTQHCPHGKHHGPSGNRRPKSAVGRLSSGRQTTFVKEKWGDFSASEDERGAASLGYDPFPDLLAHSDEGPVRTSAHCKFSEASELLSSELTRSTIDPRSPLTIERVTDTPHGNERGRHVLQRRSRKDDIMTRSVPEFRSDGSPVLHSYGKSSYGRSSPRAIPVRKVSSKRSSASITTPTDVVLPAGMSSTRSFDGSAVSSSMTASTVAAAGTSRLHHHQRSPSDGGLHRSSSFRTPTGRSPYATVATASPRKGQRSSSVSAISCPPPYSPRNIPSRVPSSRYGNVPAVQPVSQNNLNITTTINHNNNQQQQQQQQNIHNNNNNSAALLVESDPLLKQRSQAVGLEVLDRAAVKIQALWRGYRARAHMDKVHKVCQEVRLRRLEECVLDIQSKLTTVNKALLKQQKELEEERKYRTSNNEALNKLLTN
ncbi:hypothetical protein HPB47_010427, partial [Ixodes persulcatus]